MRSRALLAAALAFAVELAGAFASASAARAAGNDAGATAGAARPVYYQRVLTEADVAGRTLRELAIMRNTIFARAGQPFRKQWLHDYFSAQPWYTPKAIVDPKTLPPVDQKNADFLSHYEIEMPRAELERRFKALEERHHNATGGDATAIAFTPDGKRAMLAGTAAIRLVELPAGRPAATWQVSYRSVGLMPGKLRALALTHNGEMETIDLVPGGTGKVVSTMRSDPLQGRRGVFSADGRRFLAGGVWETIDSGPDEGLSEDTTVAADVATGKILIKRETDDGQPCLALTPDGARALVADLGTVSLWDLGSGKATWTRAIDAKANGTRCAAVAIAADGKRAVTAAPAGSQLFDLASGKVLRTLALRPANALVFSPRGDQLLVGGGSDQPSGGAAPSLEIWDVEQGKRIRALPVAGPVAAVAWSPDGARVLSDGGRGPALWDAATGRALPAFAGHETWWNRDEQIEMVLLSRALGRALAGYTFDQLDIERTPFDAPELLDELVPAAQLKDMSRRDLRLLRNMVYARRGRAFRSPILRDYFQRIDWYKADPTYSDARLTAIDRRNIKLIQSVEIELGGPINDRQHQEEDVPEA